MTSRIRRSTMYNMLRAKFSTICAVVVGTAVAMTGIGLVIWCAQPKKPDQTASRQVSKDNLKHIILAMFNYVSSNNRFPSAAIYSQDGKPLLSWRVVILPAIEQEDLYKQFKLDEPWNSEHNKKLLPKMPAVYRLRDAGAKDGYSTHFQVFVGKGTMFEPGRKIRFSDVRDGASNTFAVVEAAEAVPWTKPADLEYDSAKPLPSLGGMGDGAFLGAMVDGSVRLINDKVDEKFMRAAITRSGAEIANIDDLLK